MNQRRISLFSVKIYIVKTSVKFIINFLRTVYICIVIGAFVLLVTSINYMVRRSTQSILVVVSLETRVRRVWFINADDYGHPVA
jgi:hypothetical protein